ncbi:flagellin [Turneriella parva]|uniref:Flagellin domain protein n=1 Tax=Turneriella parva (strain ATCC BAA-1111 / DSM 21527 / NCTC 11395 / H) TaxID=869212 RepID=I4B9J3_TURPD|nr:flagellin domain protein [Turneriella parva]AFM13950.1 flagellin domain protein [Turneriella parva DSM 21527]
MEIYALSKSPKATQPVGNTKNAVSRPSNFNKPDEAKISVTAQMKARLRQIQQSQENLASGITMLNVADGYLAEMQGITERLKVLALKATNGTDSAFDRQMAQVTVSSLIDELDRVAKDSSYKHMRLFLGDYARTSKTASMWFQIDMTPNSRHRIFLATMTSSAMRLSEAGAKISISTALQGSDAIGVFNDALERVKKQRADISADAEKFEFAMTGLDKEAQALKQGIESIETRRNTHKKVAP